MATSDPADVDIPTLSSLSTSPDDGDEDADILSPPLSTLREISTLASWTVSTYKPGCGVSALRSPLPTQFWQSDGPQPHLLNIHFFKLVTIARLRIYLDLEADESYTPTRMLFLAGHSEYDVVEFSEWRAPQLASPETPGPKGWVDVGLERCWGRGAEGDEDAGEAEGEGLLRCMFLQVKVLENHQNGKDTHIRGVQIWAKDEREREVFGGGGQTAVGGMIGAAGPGVGGGSKGRGGAEGRAVRDERVVWEEELERWVDGNVGDAVLR